MSPNQSLQPTAGRRTASLYYENTSIASHARPRQRWLISFSLDLMHVHSGFFIGPAIAFVLASCSTPGPLISGRTQEISATDIQAPVVALQGSIVDGPVRVDEIEIISHDEVRMHDEPAPSNYITMVRVRGNWQVGRVVLVHPRY